jgi:glycosyltransferase involved in cell wall biosynthesis
MKIVFIRTKTDSTVFFQNRTASPELDDAALEQMKISVKAGSSSKNIILGLRKHNLISSCEEWKFWGGAFRDVKLPGQVLVKLFSINGNFTSKDLAQYVGESGQPDILWVEGPDYPPYLEQIFDLCPDSFKIVYSKDWRPWKIENLHHYNLCLVDEAWQAEKIRRHCPEVHSAVWDKLIDYETSHYPMACDKIYDVCYVAYLRERKNHALLFQAIAKLKDRRLSCVCVGDDRKGCRAELEKMAASMNVKAHFTGEVPKLEVNTYINQSRIGVMCSEMDAVPRAILEYMAADVPVLANAKLLAGARYVVSGAGLVRPPEQFHLGLLEILDHYQDFSPREKYLEQYSVEKILDKFIAILQSAGCDLKNPPPLRVAPASLA